jgi:hypothetical protein
MTVRAKLGQNPQTRVELTRVPCPAHRVRDHAERRSEDAADPNRSDETKR